MKSAREIGPSELIRAVSWFFRDAVVIAGAVLG
jgi:hypothetical protein